MRAILLAAVACSTSHAAAQAFPQFQPTFPAALASPYILTCTFGDFDNDGDLDLVAPRFWNGMQLLANDGLGGLLDVSAQLPPVNVGYWAVIPIWLDHDRDGDLDLFVNWDGGAVLIRNDGGGAWTNLTVTLPQAPILTRVAAGDMDGDGAIDIVGVGTPLSGGSNRILHNVNGVFVPIDAFPGYATTVAVADIDGDGDLDIMTGIGRLWRNLGALSFVDITATHLPPLVTCITQMEFGDVDGDGDRDVVISGCSNAPIEQLLQNDGSGVFTIAAGAIPANFGPTGTLDLVDVDEDGDLDLVRGGAPTPNLSLNDGTGHFTLAPNRWPLVPGLLADVAVADLDRDGDVDAVLTRLNSPGRILWNHHRHLAVPAPPTIGQSWQVEVWGQPGYGVGHRAVTLAIGLARLAQPVVVPPFGVLWLDLGVPFLLDHGILAPAAGPAVRTFAVPFAPSLLGVDLHLQALVEEVAGTGLARLTSLRTATIQ